MTLPLLPPPLQGCKSTFLDAVLSASRLEMFMPGVDIISENEHVNELHIIVRGSVKVGAAQRRKPEPRREPCSYMP